jgi:hypothetical protein
MAVLKMLLLILKLTSIDDIQSRAKWEGDHARLWRNVKTKGRTTRCIFKGARNLQTSRVEAG